MRCEMHAEGDFVGVCFECGRLQAEEAELVRREGFVAAATSHWGAGDLRVTETYGIMSALVSDVLIGSPMPPHVRLATFLPAGEVDAVWIRDAVLDLLVGMVAASVNADAWPDATLEWAMHFSAPVTDS
jgi:hypothetical protein